VLLFEVFPIGDGRLQIFFLAHKRGIVLDKGHRKSGLININYGQWRRELLVCYSFSNINAFYPCNGNNISGIGLFDLNTP
jgi:hypothetical protein